MNNIVKLMLFFSMMLYILTYYQYYYHYLFLENVSYVWFVSLLLVCGSKKEQWRYYFHFIFCSYFLIFSNLKREWVFQRGNNLDDLKKIAYAMYYSLDELDPMRYTHKPELYMNKLIEFKDKN